MEPTRQADQIPDSEKQIDQKKGSTDTSKAASDSTKKTKKSDQVRESLHKSGAASAGLSKAAGAGGGADPITSHHHVAKAAKPDAAAASAGASAGAASPLSLNRDTILAQAKAIADQFKSMRDENPVHGDIKAANTLYATKRQAMPDFGLAGGGGAATAPMKEDEAARLRNPPKKGEGKGAAREPMAGAAARREEFQDFGARRKSHYEEFRDVGARRKGHYSERSQSHTSPESFGTNTRDAAKAASAGSSAGAAAPHAVSGGGGGAGAAEATHSQSSVTLQLREIASAYRDPMTSNSDKAGLLYDALRRGPEGIQLAVELLRGESKGKDEKVAEAAKKNILDHLDSFATADIRKIFKEALESAQTSSAAKAPSKSPELAKYAEQLAKEATPVGKGSILAKALKENIANDQLCTEIMQLIDRSTMDTPTFQVIARTVKTLVLDISNPATINQLRRLTREGFFS